MSNKRRAVILQIPQRLFFDDMECSEFASLLNDLPEGTTMRGIREDLPTDSTLICIQNDCFIETEECQQLPRVQVSQQFEQNDDGGEAYLYWDLDPVMEKKPEIKDDPLFGVDSSGYKNWYPIPRSGHYEIKTNFSMAEELQPLQMEINKIASQIFEQQLIIGQSAVKVTLDENNNWKTEYPAEFVGPVQPTCEHEWKQYVGLTESYNYCNKCDLKDHA